MSGKINRGRKWLVGNTKSSEQIYIYIKERKEDLPTTTEYKEANHGGWNRNKSQN
jgi:hypothetical protein